MRKILPRVLASSATLIAVLAPSAGAYFGLHDRVETIYVEPTTTTMFMPTAYTEILPTAYSYSVPIPTTYVTTSATLLPASYSYRTTSYTPVATAYYVPTYYRAGLFGRRVRPAIYEPTVYIPSAVTTVDAPVMATSYRGPCQESSIAFNPPPTAPIPSTKGITSKPNGGEPTYTGPVDKKTDTSAETTKAAEAARDREKAAGAVADPGDGQPSPPPAPAPEKKDDPNSDMSLPDAKPGGGRQSLRPAATELRPKLGASAQNVLRGEVVSGVTGKTLPAVKIVFSDLSGHYKDRIKETDAKGGFDVFLPNGDWSITVVDPSAAAGVQPKVVGNITSTSGKYLDESDRPIYSLKVWN